jgi:hypothetical protein
VTVSDFIVIYISQKEAPKAINNKRSADVCDTLYVQVSYYEQKTLAW